MAAPLADAQEGSAGGPVALVGLGNMGQAVAERLLDAGYPLAVYNRTPDRADAGHLLHQWLRRGVDRRDVHERSAQQ